MSSQGTSLLSRLSSGSQGTRLATLSTLAPPTSPRTLASLSALAPPTSPPTLTRSSGSLSRSRPLSSVLNQPVSSLIPGSPRLSLLPTSPAPLLPTFTGTVSQLSQPVQILQTVQTESLPIDEQLRRLAETGQVSRLVQDFLLENGASIGLNKEYIVRANARADPGLRKAEQVVLKNIELAAIANAGFSITQHKNKSLEELIVLARAARTRSYLLKLVAALGFDVVALSAYSNDTILSMLLAEARKRNETIDALAQSVNIGVPEEIHQSIRLQIVRPSSPRSSIASVVSRVARPSSPSKMSSLSTPTPQISSIVPVLTPVLSAGTRTASLSPRSRLASQVATTPVEIGLNLVQPTMNVAPGTFVSVYNEQNTETIRGALERLGVDGAPSATREQMDAYVGSLISQPSAQQSMNTIYSVLTAK
jgi:hypothetical protein